jgi:CheY-like chemotaxis protein
MSVARARSGTEAQGTASLRFSVIDTGPGIPPDRLNRLFQAFSQVDASTTRRHGGTGLGLAISKKLVMLMGGDIGVESAEGSGSNFSFTLPMEPSINLPTGQASRVLQGTRALLVDDNAINCRILQTQLRAWGGETIVAQSADEALAILANSAPFSFAVLDFQMPETDGIGLAKAIRENSVHRSLPLILFTSVVPMPMLHKDRLAGLEIADVLTKPIKPLALRNALLRLVSHGKAVSDTSCSPDMRQETLLAEECPLQILLVDDNVINRKLGRKVLERLGYSPEMAEDGRLAAAACSERRFDVVLMDIEMPELNGEEACRAIRRTLGRASPFLVALTANAIVGDRERYLAAGFDGYLSKPLDVGELRAQLERANRTRKN